MTARVKNQLQGRTRALVGDITQFVASRCLEHPPLPIECGLVAMALVVQTSLQIYKKNDTFDPAISRIMRRILVEALKELE